MKHFAKGLFSVVLLTCMTAQAANQWGTSFLLGGNIGNIQGGGLIEEAGRCHRYDSDKMYGCFSSHMEYNKSTKSGDLGTFFSPINNNTFRLGKVDNVAANSATDVYNVYMLLEENYEADITFKPVSTTFTTNLGLFVGLDEFMEGLWMSVDLPIVHNKRQVKITETQVTAATNTTFPAEYFLNNTAVNTVYNNFVEAIKGDKGLTNGCLVNNLKYGQINGSQSHTKVGNVTVALGYDFMNKENAHLGVGLSALINGNGKSDAVYMFEPSVGTGGRHGVGATVNGHIRAYEKDDAEINLYLKANVHHLFDATVLRTYDFTTKHGKWSRYILYKHFTTLAAAADVNGIVHGVNISTLNAKVGIGAMYDVNLMAAYTSGNLGVNVGYGLSGHSAEKHKSWVDTMSTNYGAWATHTTAASAADMDTDNTNSTDLSTDVKIDGGNGSNTNPTIAANSASNVLVRTDLDVNSAMSPSALVHTVYGDVNYNWDDSEWEPRVGVGGGASFANSNKSISQWGVHFHGGICF